MRRFLSLVFLVSTALGQQSGVPSPGPYSQQNWSLPRVHRTQGDPYQNGGWIVPVTPTTMQIFYTLPATPPSCPYGLWNHTAAAVYNNAGTLIKHLWYYETLPPGQVGRIWNGLDDSGNAASGGPYTPKIEYDCLQNNWDGIIGETEQSWDGPHNWDRSAASYPGRPAFLNGMAYAPGRYAEGALAGFAFSESSPNGYINFQWIDPRTYGVNTYEAATDGNLIYFLYQALSASNPFQHQGIVAFYPSGQPYAFSSGTSISGLWNTGGIVHPIVSPSICDASVIPTAAITGLAVQKSGNILAGAHGAYIANTLSQTPAVASVDTVSLWNKTTCASLGSVSIPNPQQMHFDLNGDLWVISGLPNGGTGGQKLYKITSVGSSNTVTDMTSTLSLSNPVSVAVSPTSGNVFVADGGNHQQVFEFLPTSPFSLQSTLGAAGGFGQSTACNANIDPGGHNSPTFWFDPSTVGTYITGGNSTTFSWVAVDDMGRLWVSDFTDQRIVEYSKSGSAWNYIQGVQETTWAYRVSVPVNGDGTRVWGGQDGFLEYSRNLSLPLKPGDPDPAMGGNAAWAPVRNWGACIQAIVPSGAFPSYFVDVKNLITYSNGHTIMFPYSDKTFNYAHMMDMPTSGVLTYEPMVSAASGFAFFDTAGFYNLISSGSGPTYSYTIGRYPSSGFDGAGFPLFGSLTTLASYTADASQGQPRATSGQWNFTPTTAGNIPVYQSGPNTTVTGTTPAFNFGFVPNNGGASSLISMSNPEKRQMWSNGDGSFPLVSLGGNQQGANTLTLGNDVFAFYNGNNTPWGCQWLHFYTDGMFIGQFGFQSGYAYNNVTGNLGPPGYPIKGSTLPLAPAECADVSNPTGVQVGGNFYLWIGDEDYRHGIHEFSVTNTSSFHEATGSCALGVMCTLTQAF